ncbi:MAG: anti-sigma factor [Gemmatimonadaceae bacterium]
MTDISHESADRELAAVALGSASFGVGEAVRSHAAACPECGPELAAMEETIAILGYLVPREEMNRGRSAGIRSRLIARARAERESKAPPVTGRPDIARGVASLTGLGHKATPASQRAITGETRRVTPGQQTSVPPAAPAMPPVAITWYAAIATVALVATGVQLLRVSSESRTVRNQLAAVDTLAPLADSLQSIVRQRESMIAAMTGEDVTAIPLSSRTDRQAGGRMLWNPVSNDWVLITHGLRPPRDGRTYQVWIVTDQGWVSAGTFQPDESGSAMMHTKQAIERGVLRSVTVTEEPEGGAASPTGSMVVSGSV